MVRSFFYISIGILCVCLLSCSKNDWEQADVPVVQDREKSKAYLTISLSLPQAIDSRSQTDQEGGTGITQAGLATENNIQDGWILLGKLAPGQINPLQINHCFYIDQFKYTGSSAQWSATIQCEPGRYRIIVIANPNQGLILNPEELKSTGWDKFVTSVVSYPLYAHLQKSWEDNHFMMSNAYRHDADNVVVLEAGVHTYKELLVQRTCARFDYQVYNPQNEYRMECRVDEVNTTLPITLTDATLINISNNFNLFKMVVTEAYQGAVPDYFQYETPHNYVHDSDWESKWMLIGEINNSLLSDYFFFSSHQKPWGSAPSTEPLKYIQLPKVRNQESIMAYASENTLPGIHTQVNKLSTGVVFKGYFTWEPSQSPITEIYYRQLKNGNHLYTSIESLKAALIADGHTMGTSTPTDTEWAQWGVIKFTKDQEGRFPVYYTYWNRHHDNQNPEKMGKMEFAVVRNNVYKLAVKSISSLGLPLPPNDPNNPWRPHGDTPDEQIPQLEINVEVCNWVNRTLIHDI